jgi:hypothetical protein
VPALGRQAARRRGEGRPVAVQPQERHDRSQARIFHQSHISELLRTKIFPKSKQQFHPIILVKTL